MRAFEAPLRFPAGRFISSFRSHYCGNGGDPGGLGSVVPDPEPELCPEDVLPLPESSVDGNSAAAERFPSCRSC